LSGQRTPESSDDEKIQAPKEAQESYKPLAVVPNSKVNFVIENKKKGK